MLRKILLAYDGSEPSDLAFRYALDLAQRFAAPMEVLAVLRPPDFAGEVPETAALVDSGRRYFDQRFAALRSSAGEAGAELRFCVAVGQPADQILAHARRSGADFIVMGHRGKSLVQRWLTGSTTKQVMGYAHCPVLIVR